MKSKKCCHPEPSQSEGVRILSDDDAPVTLRIRFVNPWGSHPLSFLKDGILTSQNTLLRMTEGVDGILTSQNTLLRIRLCHNYLLISIKE